MYIREFVTRALALLVIPFGLVACVADGTEPTEMEQVDVAREGFTQPDEIVSGGDEQDLSTTETNAGCLTYVGVVTVKEYDCPCWITDYYDRFYNVCNGTYADTYLYSKTSCSYKYGICP